MKNVKCVRKVRAKLQKPLLFLARDQMLSNLDDNFLSCAQLPVCLHETLQYSHWLFMSHTEESSCWFMFPCVLGCNQMYCAAFHILSCSLFLSLSVTDIHKHHQALIIITLIIVVLILATGPEYLLCWTSPSYNHQQRKVVTSVKLKNSYIDINTLSYDIKNWKRYHFL